MLQSTLFKSVEYEHFPVLSGLRKYQNQKHLRLGSLDIHSEWNNCTLLILCDKHCKQPPSSFLWKRMLSEIFQIVVCMHACWIVEFHKKNLPFICPNCNSVRQNTVSLKGAAKWCTVISLVLFKSMKSDNVIMPFWEVLYLACSH